MIGSKIIKLWLKQEELKEVVIANDLKEGPYNPIELKVIIRGSKYLLKIGLALEFQN